MNKKEAQDLASQFIEFYKQGFLDGYIRGRRRYGKMCNPKKIWIEIEPLCRECWVERFEKPVNRKIKKIRKQELLNADMQSMEDEE